MSKAAISTSSAMSKTWGKQVTPRHRRWRGYGIALFVILSVGYLLCRPNDTLSLDFTRHTAFMNRKHQNIQSALTGQSFDWREAPFHNRPEKYTPLPKGTPQKLPAVQYPFHDMPSSLRAKQEKRRNVVRNEFIRSWNSYKKAAWMRDELMPISFQGHDTFGGWGATLVDALDTLWIMGLKDEFYEAVDAVARIDFGKSDTTVNLSVFETTIRFLGGLIAAYDLSGERILRDKAIQLGELLYRAFDTPNHMPLSYLPIERAKSGQGFTADSNVCVAAIGSLTMEFARLAQITHEPKYYDAVARITEVFDNAQNSTKLPGLFPTWMNAYVQDLSYDRSFTLGALADSAYEYFPKTHALLGGLEPVYEKVWDDFIQAIDKHMLFRPMVPGNDDILVAGHASASGANKVSLEPEGEHLACFIGGMFALGGRLFENQYHVDVGAKLTEGCIWAYRALPTGIMPEIFNLVPCESRTNCQWDQHKWEAEVQHHSWGTKDVKAAIADQRLPKGFSSIRDRRYILRPEAIESVFILYRITGHEEYLEAAWDMFESIKKFTSTKFANAALNDVTDGSAEPSQTDSMESFWLAETLKYFYLIFSPPDMISLDDFVLNTEAHPFRRPQ